MLSTSKLVPCIKIQSHFLHHWPHPSRWAFTSWSTLLAEAASRPSSFRLWGGTVVKFVVKHSGQVCCEAQWSSQQKKRKRFLAKKSSMFRSKSFFSLGAKITETKNWTNFAALVFLIVRIYQSIFEVEWLFHKYRHHHYARAQRIL